MASCLLLSRAPKHAAHARGFGPVAFSHLVLSRRGERRASTSPPAPAPTPSAAEREQLRSLVQRYPSLVAELLPELPPEARTQTLARALSRSELHEDLDSEFQRADSNRDGKISLQEFQVWGEKLASEEGESAAEPSSRQLFWQFVRSALPFVGFGCVDNAMMVLTGEAIDSTFGVMLGISTMAAAALGNGVSNVIGMGAHGTIERFISKLGVPNPHLTPAQLRTPRVHLLKVSAGAIGVFVGCCLGMTPLLFIGGEPPTPQPTLGTTVAPQTSEE